MLLVKNRKAYFNHEIIEKYLAGIVLKGYEVKAIKEKRASFEGSFVSILDGNVILKNLNIGQYSKQSQEHSDITAKRDRQLLLNHHEIYKLKRELSEKGKTAVPLAFLLKHGRIKLEFAIVRGRKKHEKKHLLKKRQIEKDLQKTIKSSGFLM